MTDNSERSAGNSEEQPPKPRRRGRAKGARQTGPGKRFAPGKSGNPKGRPRKGQSIAELCRLHRDDMVAILVECAKDKEARWADRVHAASIVIAYADGKPGTVDDDALTPDEVDGVDFVRRPAQYQADESADAPRAD